MSKADDVIKARNNLAALAAELSMIRIRPWNFWKVLKMVRDTQCAVLQLCGEMMVSHHHLIDGVEKCVMSDLILDQRVNKVWAEVYRIEELRRKMEESQPK